MSSDGKKASWFARVWPKRLTLGFGIAVSVAVLITEVIFLIPASYFWHRTNESEAVESVRLAWYHSSNPSAFLTVEEKTRVGERMMRDGIILGGVIYDTAGDPLAVFGERPVLDLNIARLSGVSVQPSPTAAAIDVHFSPEQTDLSHHLVVRLSTDPIELQTLVQLRNFGLSVLFIAGLTAILFIAASMLLVIRPLRSINQALRQAVENPDRADGFHLHMARRDEIGQISGSLNMLLTSVSVVFQDELAALKRANEVFGFGIMQYDHEDRLVTANSTAIEQFQQKDFDALRRMNRNCAQPLGAKGTRPQPLVDLLGETSEPMLLTLHTDTSFFTAMAFCATVRRPDGTVMNRSIAIIEMDAILKNSRKSIMDGQKAKSALHLAQVEQQEMRRLLESCLCLIEPSAPADDEVVNHLLPDRILNDWYQEASRDELVTGELEHGLLYALSGDKSAIRHVLRQAMLLAYSQTEAERPVLKVDASKPTDELVRFVITDVSQDRTSVGRARRKKGVDPTLPSAALRNALKRAGGSFDGLSAGKGPAKVIFTLAAAKSTEIEVPTIVAKDAA